ncbi:MULTISPECIES: carbohydrate ABC transporter permease [Streptomyces]|jgi:multiple sugar transport system permease protein|uniref:Carbohydrate ABC transporter permease n=2 Tax=Streptomyces TaxID=1883 RepID=A0ABU3J8D6_9ACTN|nr:carbohydrate ABC transporter permease [Streptomyces sp. McG7]MBT2907206.1 carbohydrate ABC transporter permease [Streptomyces sp. McG8]MDQ0487779.1 multiple sugar transport system permease protein [Streptomyces thermodiastaticus]MDT6971320.1 carbohydrate ABC transporter permease [Streptomyces thermocarboxydus]MDX3419097.1 carbohydrate ABC transporter permease [Streptomyces sp. MD20-1-1]MXQ61046.1 ABC transporter permease subunit [Streptomyces sp. XHT-2]MYW50400.1 ABC transporter permease s
MAQQTIPAPVDTPKSASTGGSNRAVRPRRALRPRTVVVAAVAWLIAAVFLLPYLQMVITALRPASELRDATYLPDQFAWSNFVDVWRESNLGSNLRVTLLVAGGSTLLVLLVAIPAAYYTARVKYRGRKVFLLLVLVTQMFQPTSLLVGLYREFYQLGMLNSVWTLVLCNAAFNLAFAIWILTAYFSAIPVQLEEAAMIDGLGRGGALLRVTLPLAMPGVVTAVIFTFIAAWNEFVMGLTLSTVPESQPLTVGINSFIGNYTVQWNYLFAASVIAIVPVVVLFAFIERHVVSGLTAGSVK